MKFKKFIKEYPDVHTAYIGWKISNGEIVVDEFGKPVKALVAAVEKKLPLSELSNPVPKTYNAYVTDVIEMPRMYANPPIKKTSTDLQSRIRPLAGGLSIGHKGITAGTLGCVVFTEEMSYEPPEQGNLSWWHQFLKWLKKVFGIETLSDLVPGKMTITSIPLLMSNNHVLANENMAKIGDEILQPGKHDGGRLETDVVGFLDSFTPIEFDRPNIMDVAFATLTDGVDYVPGIIDRWVMRDDIAKPELDMLVEKTGRTTGYKVGKIIGLDASSYVEYDYGTAYFEDQILIQDINGHFSAGGDSGSLITDGDGRPVGLLFAGGGDITLANKMQNIVDEYGITFFPSD